MVDPVDIEVSLARAQSGDADSMFALALIYKERGEDTEFESWLRQAANAENQNALNELGDLLHKKSDTAGAEGWYLKSAELGNAYAMNMLGNIHDDKAEISHAEAWYRRAGGLG